MSASHASAMTSLEESFIILGSTGPASLDPSMSIINAETSLPNGDGRPSVENSAPASRDQMDSMKSSFKSIVNRSLGETFASKFLLGEIDQDALKNSVFEQFPSINSSQTAVDDVVKLYSLLDEHAQLKDNLQKSNLTLRKQFNFLQDWQDRVKVRMAEKNKLISDLQTQLATLQESSEDTTDSLKKSLQNLMTKVEVLETEKKDLIKLNQDLRQEMAELDERTKIVIECLQTDNAAHIMALSEKDSVIRNIHEQLARIESERESIVYVSKHETASPQGDTILKSEHERAIREVNRQLSEVTAQNLEFGDMRKIYKDELDCLKVNLTSAEELQKQMQATIATLQASNAENSRRAAQAERELTTARERIDLLNAQVEIYRNDFHMEREAREKLASEKDNILSDLNLLQRRNKELVDDAQAVLNAPPPSPSTGAIRKTPTPPSQSKENSPTVEETAKFVCPVCNMETKTLRLLEQHLESCLKD